MLADCHATPYCTKFNIVLLHTHMKVCHGELSLLPHTPCHDKPSQSLLALHVHTSHDVRNTSRPSLVARFTIAYSLISFLCCAFIRQLCVCQCVVRAKKSYIYRSSLWEVKMFSHTYNTIIMNGQEPEWVTHNEVWEIVQSTWKSMVHLVKFSPCPETHFKYSPVQEGENQGGRTSNLDSHYILVVHQG